jgi:hypothetical protein
MSVYLLSKWADETMRCDAINAINSGFDAAFQRERGWTMLVFLLLHDGWKGPTYFSFLSVFT